MQLVGSSCRSSVAVAARAAGLHRTGAACTIAVALALFAGGAAAQPVRATSSPIPDLVSLAPYVPIATGLTQPRGVAIGPSGAAYVSDEQDGRICKLADGAKRVVAGGLKRPQGLVAEDAGHLLVLAEKLPPNADGTKGALLRVDVATGAGTVLASHLEKPRNLLRLTDGRGYVTAKKLVDQGEDEMGLVLRLAEGQPLEVVASGFKEPSGVIANADGSLLMAAERCGQGPTYLTGSVFAVDAAGSVSVAVAEDLTQPSARGGPVGLTLLPHGGRTRGDVATVRPRLTIPTAWLDRMRAGFGASRRSRVGSCRVCVVG